MKIACSSVIPALEGGEARAGQACAGTPTPHSDRGPRSTVQRPLHLDMLGTGGNVTVANHFSFLGVLLSLERAACRGSPAISEPEAKGTINYTDPV